MINVGTRCTLDIWYTRDISRALLFYARDISGKVGYVLISERKNLLRCTKSISKALIFMEECYFISES